MKNAGRLFLPVAALSLLRLHIPASGGAQTPTTPNASPGLQFASGQSARDIPFEFAGNHIYLRARVNDSEPLWFLLDTGATASYLDERHVDSLGSGDPGESLRGAAITFPGMALSNQDLSSRPFGFSAYDGHAIDGLLGYDFVSRLVIEIDYAKRTVSLHEPRNYEYSGSGDILPLVMLEDDSGGKVPLVRVQIRQEGRAPVEGQFIADLAVRAAIAFNTPFVDANHLLEPPQKTIQAVLGAGAMVRESKQPVGRLRGMGLGRFTIENPIAIFFRDKQGIMSIPDFDGVLGGEVLRRFKIVFDYSRERLILEPNRYFSEPYEHDMAGLLLVADGAAFRVRQVMDGSPASAAGLREGDLITAVDGRSWKICG